ncbi:hypothetical protein [Mycolicibacterium komossense]|uniref:Uncharacterized protein n=1 Tax=Mycolicibacterium komossense TaxID=1779 RepID=A0ABT3C9B9_9MYCO|nr:hypothetical protein [Mycolicibacterium komossense]MCV7226079.1 hypothetical protein [Mycolicibacterium komossense]
MSERPDFVMVGGQSDGKFFLLASKSLNHVELSMERDRIQAYGVWPEPWGRPRHTVTADMRDYVTIIADSYAQAFRDLFDVWDPMPGRAEIAGVRAVTQRGRNIAYHELGVETPALDAPKAIER